MIRRDLAISAFNALAAFAFPNSAALLKRAIRDSIGFGTE
jgi:hypothetical protein